jgi:hypothetical protein
MITRTFSIKCMSYFNMLHHSLSNQLVILLLISIKLKTNITITPIMIGLASINFYMLLYNFLFNPLCYSI